MARYMLVSNVWTGFASLRKHRKHEISRRRPIPKPVSSHELQGYLYMLASHASTVSRFPSQVSMSSIAIHVDPMARNMSPRTQRGVTRFTQMARYLFASHASQIHSLRTANGERPACLARHASYVRLAHIFICLTDNSKDPACIARIVDLFVCTDGEVCA